MVFLTCEKMFRLRTDPDPDPDLSLPGPGSSFSDPWQLYCGSILILTNKRGRHEYVVIYVRSQLRDG